MGAWGAKMISVHPAQRFDGSGLMLTMIKDTLTTSFFRYGKRIG
jgi:hypothetical protein